MKKGEWDAARAEFHARFPAAGFQQAWEAKRAAGARKTWPEKYDEAEAEMRAAGRWPAEGVALEFSQAAGPREKAVTQRQYVSSSLYLALLRTVTRAIDALFACRASSYDVLPGMLSAQSSTRGFPPLDSGRLGRPSAPRWRRR